jgi:hypothetical protein
MARIDDIAYVGCACPDLNLAERFLADFGMLSAARNSETFYMRGAGPRHRIYVARKGDTAGFACVAFTAASPADLAAFAMLESASAVAAIDARGWRNFWGIGRHVIGSQGFDDWEHPFGNTVAHYADGDLFDATRQPGYFPASPEYLSVWGPPVPADFLV